MLRLLLCLVVLGAGVAEQLARADDWPQWMGPKRDNVWRETGIVESLPKEPKVVWRAPVAGGYSGPAVVGDKVYVTDFTTKDNVKIDNFGRKEFSGDERILCLDDKTGRELWSRKFPETYSMSYPAGPRATPIVEDGKVFFHGAEGTICCLDATSGEVIWSKNLKAAYKTKTALWGYSSQPLIDGNKLILIAGGEGSHCVALNKNSGDEIWRTGTAAEQGYCPPLIIEQAGVRQLVLCNPESIYAVDPETGKPLWSQEYKADNGGIIMTPLRWGNDLFVGGFNNKNILIELASDKPGAKTLWRDQVKKGISPINVQPIVVDGKVFGLDQSGDLRCVDMLSGEILWSTAKPLGDRKVNSGTVFLVRSGTTDKFFMFAESGDLILGQLTPQGFTELSRMHVIEATNNAFGRQVVWCAPAFAHKRMYVRNDKELVCVNLAK